MINFYNSRKQVQVIKKAYNQTVEDFKNGRSELEYLPDNFKNSVEFKKFIKTTQCCNSGDILIKDYLNPIDGMNYLDVGSCANLISYKLHEWQSLYYGIDISQKLVNVTNSFVKTNRIIIGGLVASEIAYLPFTNDYFDLASVIGVLEYYEIDYNILALQELNRVLKNEGKLVIDLPNETHPGLITMIEYEKYLGRPRKTIVSRQEFITVLKIFFKIEDIDDSQLMIKFFLRNSK